MNNLPTLKIIVGVPGSGKSSYCKKAVNECSGAVYFSSDEIREELFGNASSQEDNARVFQVMQDRTLNALAQGKTVYYDATNITRKSRSSILDKCEPIVQKECIVVWAPPEICVERDSQRGWHVGENVIHKMLKSFQAPYFDEGFKSIRVINTVDNFKSVQYADNLEQLDLAHDNVHHKLSIREHMISAESYTKLHTDNFDLHRAARFHDIGKYSTKQFANAKGEPTTEAHYYGHEGYGAWLSYGFAWSNNHIAWLISNHMEPYKNSKYYQHMMPCLKEQLDLIHHADVSAN